MLYKEVAGIEPPTSLDEKSLQEYENKIRKFMEEVSSDPSKMETVFEKVAKLSGMGELLDQMDSLSDRYQKENVISEEDVKKAMGQGFNFNDNNEKDNDELLEETIKNMPQQKRVEEFDNIEDLQKSYLDDKRNFKSYEKTQNMDIGGINVTIDTESEKEEW